MNQGLIPRRYAKALLMSSQEHGTAEQLYTAMQHLSAAFALEPALAKALANPAIAPQSKVELLLTAAAPIEPKAADALKDFASLLIANRRIHMMHLCALAFVKLYRQANGIYLAEVTSAAPLTDSETKRIDRIIAAQLPPKASVHPSFKIDSALIGGFTIDIDNVVLDASVASQLNQLRQKLLSH